jgi:hypothetical protein
MMTDMDVEPPALLSPFNVATDARTTATRNEHHLQHLFPTVITHTMALRSAAATIAKRVALAAAPQVR